MENFITIFLYSAGCYGLSSYLYLAPYIDFNNKIHNLSIRKYLIFVIVLCTSFIFLLIIINERLILEAFSLMIVPLGISFLIWLIGRYIRLGKFVFLGNWMSISFVLGMASYLIVQENHSIVIVYGLAAAIVGFVVTGYVAYSSKEKISYKRVLKIKDLL